MTINGKFRSSEELFSVYFINVNFILNFKKKKKKKKKERERGVNPFETDSERRHSWSLIGFYLLGKRPKVGRPKFLVHGRSIG